MGVVVLQKQVRQVKFIYHPAVVVLCDPLTEAFDSILTVSAAEWNMENQNVLFFRGRHGNQVGYLSALRFAVSMDIEEIITVGRDLIVIVEVIVQNDDGELIGRFPHGLQIRFGVDRHHDKAVGIFGGNLRQNGAQFGIIARAGEADGARADGILWVGRNGVLHLIDGGLPEEFRFFLYHHGDDLGVYFGLRGGGNLGIVGMNVVQDIFFVWKA